MGERGKQNSLSALITAIGVGLLYFCHHDALSNGEYSLKLVLVGSILLIWGPLSFVLNFRDPTTTKRAIERLSSKSPGSGPGVKAALAFLVVGLLVSAGLDYLFTAWIDHDLASCRAAHACDGGSGTSKGSSQV